MVLDIQTYKTKQKGVTDLRSKLNELTDKKEFWFKKKEDLKKEINDLINKIKEIKAAKDKNNVELQQLKEQRDKHNNEVHRLIKSIRILNNEKEKKLMEEIKKLKKAYEESSEVATISEKAEGLEKEISESKKRADEFHKRIKELTKDTSYEVFIELSKRINERKKEQEQAFQNFIDLKNECSSVFRDLKNTQDELNVLRMVFSKDKEAQREVKKEQEKQIIEEKTKKAEEKLKSKKKLTNEDLIALQGFNDEVSY